jgi:L-threonylcarbamoyladenylate synthase
MKKKVIKVDPRCPDEKTMRFAAELLKDGCLVVFPTETVYGIGANFLDKEAVNRLYKIKKRPENKPFTIHISDMDMIGEMGCEISAFAKKLMDNFWPGALTVILKSNTGTCGFRMPDNVVAKKLIHMSEVPVAAPSANISGETPPTEARGILESLGDEIDLILDAGATEFAKESTVVDTSVIPYKILRRGAIAEDKIEQVWRTLL